MDCNTARMLLCFTGLRQGELDPDEARALDVHLSSCPECGPLAEVEQRLDGRLGRAVRDIPVAENLRQSLLSRLGAERDAFYRRWLFRAASVAAVLTLSAWLGWWWLHRPVAIDLAEVQELVGEQYRPAPERVQAWLHTVGGGHLTAPADLQYDLLVAWGQDEFKGRMAPYLFFTGLDRAGSLQWPERSARHNARA